MLGLAISPRRSKNMKRERTRKRKARREEPSTGTRYLVEGWIITYLAYFQIYLAYPDIFKQLHFSTDIFYIYFTMMMKFGQ